jgi:hypothetical protein
MCPTNLQIVFYDQFALILSCFICQTSELPVSPCPTTMRSMLYVWSEHTYPFVDLLGRIRLCITLVLINSVLNKQYQSYPFNNSLTKQTLNSGIAYSLFVLLLVFYQQYKRMSWIGRCTQFMNSCAIRIITANTLTHRFSKNIITECFKLFCLSQTDLHSWCKVYTT